MKTYTINSELGLMRNIEADSIEQAKEIYESANGYDFDGAQAGAFPGSWYWIDEDGARAEDFTRDMP